MDRLPDFLIIAQEDWDEVWRRNQFLIAGLARRFPNTKFLFVEMPFNLTYGLRSGQLFSRQSYVRRKWQELRHGLRIHSELSNLLLLTLPKLWPLSLPGGEGLHARLSARLIKQACIRAGINQPVLWTQNPDTARLLRFLNIQALIYDNTDDWARANFSTKMRQQMFQNDLYLSRQADLVVTCSKLLTQQKRAVAKRVRYIPNGVDLKLYENLSDKANQNCLLSKIDRPILGYTGSLHSGRLDLELIEKLAKARPNWSLVFIGPNYLEPFDQQALRRFPNVHLLGAQPYTSVPGLARQFDVSILPHLVNDFTESLDPIKFYEYLATGRPIVSTPVAGVREYRELVYLAKNVDEFILAVEAGLNEDSTPGLKRQALSRQNDWEKRIDEVIEGLAQIPQLENYLVQYAN